MPLCASSLAALWKLGARGRRLWQGDFDAEEFSGGRAGVGKIEYPAISGQVALTGRRRPGGEVRRFDETVSTRGGTWHLNNDRRPETHVFDAKIRTPIIRIGVGHPFLECRVRIAVRVGGRRRSGRPDSTRGSASSRRECRRRSNPPWRAGIRRRRCRTGARASPLPSSGRAVPSRSDVTTAGGLVGDGGGIGAGVDAGRAGLEVAVGGADKKRIGVDVTGAPGQRRVGGDGRARLPALDVAIDNRDVGPAVLFVRDFRQSQ